MYGAQDPGNWQSFTNRADVKGLPLNEQKDQFLKEQINFQNMMEAIRAQAHVGGIRNNPIVNVFFRDLYPVAMTALDYNQAATDVEYLTASIDFAYQIYEIEAIS